MEKEIRRRRSILSITGIGVIFFGLWNLIKMHLIFLMGKNQLLNEAAAADENLSPTLILIIAYFLSLLLSLIDILVRLHIGRSAIKQSKGEPSSCLGACIFLLIMYVFLIALGIIDLRVSDWNILDQIVSLIVDITSFIMLFELTFASIKLRKLINAGDTASEASTCR